MKLRHYAHVSSIYENINVDMFYLLHHTPFVPKILVLDGKRQIKQETKRLPCPSLIRRENEGEKTRRMREYYWFDG